MVAKYRSSISGSLSVKPFIGSTFDNRRTLTFPMGKVKVRLLSNVEPMNGFTLNEPEIEDLYFATINNFEI